MVKRYTTAGKLQKITGIAQDGGRCMSEKKKIYYRNYTIVLSISYVILVIKSNFQR